MPMKRTTRFALAFALVASLAAGQPPDVDEHITSGKLQADLGDWKGAAAAFDAAARDPQATAAQQWEALVRLGVARRALGDARGSVEAFEQVMAEHADDSDAVRFLALSLGGALPGRERWDAIWRDVKLAVDGRGSARPSARIAWPGVGVVEPHGGDRMSLDFLDGNLGDTFRLFADFTGLNVVVQPGVRGQITIHAKDEPWQDVLQKVLAPNGYRYSLEGKLLWIAQADYVARFEPRTWKGKAVDVDYRNEDLRDALAELARYGGLQLQFDPSVAGQVTFRLVQVPWDQALEIVLRTNGLGQRPAGRQVLIAPLERR
jgi:Secretin and TonB N terminus short domain